MSLLLILFEPLKQWLLTITTASTRTIMPITFTSSPIPIRTRITSIVTDIAIANNAIIVADGYLKQNQLYWHKAAFSLVRESHQNDDAYDVDDVTKNNSELKYE